MCMLNDLGLQQYLWILPDFCKYMYFYFQYLNLCLLCLVKFCYILLVTSLYSVLAQIHFHSKRYKFHWCLCFQPKGLPWSNRQRHQVTIFNKGSFKLDLISYCRIWHPLLVVDLGRWPWNPGIGLDALWECAATLLVLVWMNFLFYSNPERQRNLPPF